MNSPYNFSNEDTVANSDGGHKIAEDADGVRHAVFVDIRSLSNGDSYQLIYARSTDQGMNWTTTALSSVVYSTDGKYIRDPSIAVKGSDIYISYAGADSAADRGVRLLKFSYNKASNTIGTVNSYWVAKNTAAQFRYSDIAIDPAGYISIVSILNNVPRYYRSTAANGTTFAEETVFSTALPGAATQTSVPHLSIDPTNSGVFLTFDCYDANLTTGWVNVYKRDSANSWSRVVFLTSAAGWIYQQTNILVRNNKIYLAYVKQPNSGNPTAYGAIYNTSGAVIDSEKVLVSGLRIYSPQIGINESGQMVVVLGYMETAQYVRHFMNSYTKSSDTSGFAAATIPFTWYSDVGGGSGWSFASGMTIRGLIHLLPDIKYNQPQVLHMAKTTTVMRVFSTLLPGGQNSTEVRHLNNNNSYTANPSTAFYQVYTNDVVSMNIRLAPNNSPVAGDAYWLGWQPAAGSGTLTLREGENYAHVQYRTAAGKLSKIYNFGPAVLYLGPGPSSTGTTEGWTSVSDKGEFYWNIPDTAASIKGYYVYWGTDPGGTSTGTLYPSRSYDPPACSTDGIYYLRVAGVDIANNTGAWKTVLTYRYDHTAPPAIGTAPVVGDWTPVSDWGGMSWAAPADTGGSGIKDYAYYWGPDSGGTSAVYTTAASCDPPNITGTTNAIYYLRVAARDNALNIGPWKTLYTYKYDAVAPAVSATDPADVWSSNSNPGALSWAAAADNAGGSGTEGYSYYWGMDETGAPVDWTTGTSYAPGAVSKEGTYYLRVQTRDNAGNTSAVKTVHRWSFDHTAPGISTTNMVEDWTSINNRALFTWTAAPDGAGSGIVGYNIRWLYGSVQQASGYVAVNSYDPPECASGDGPYYLQTQAVDRVGLAGPWTTVLTYQYDGSKPGQTASASTQNWTNNNDVPETAWLEVADGSGSGVTGYNIYWGLSPTGAAEAYQTSRTYDPVSPNTDGTYYLRVQAVDGVGLTGNWTTVLTYKYDQSKPGISPTNITEGWTSQNSRSILSWAEAPDGDGSGIAGYYMYRGTDPGGEAEDFLTRREYDSPPLSGDSRYFLRVQALDNAGNTGNWTTVYSYLYDTTPPGISPTDITEGWTSVNNRAVFSWTDAPDNLAGLDGYYVYWGRERTGVSTDYVTSAAYDPPAVTGNGIYYLNVRGVDRSGNPGAWTTVLTYQYDGVTPGGTTVISGGKTETRSKVIALFSVASDVGSSVTSLNISETGALNVWLPYAAQYNYELKNTTTGNKTLTIWFADAAGNISEPSVVTINYIGFAGADRAIIVNEDSGYINTVNATLIIDVDAGAHEMRISDDATLSAWISPGSVLPWTFSEGDGEKTVYVEYRDQAGYIWGTGIYSGSVMLDTVPPQGSFILDGGAVSTDSTLAGLTVTASGEAYAMKFWNELDAEPPDNAYIDYADTLDWTLKFIDGPQTLNMRLRDFAGNASVIYSASIYVDLASGGYSFVFNEPDGSNDIASNNFKIRWTDSYRPDPLAEIELSYIRTDGGAAGLISGNIPVADPVNGLIWDCRGLQTGSYYLKAQVSGNRGFFEATSNYPVAIVHDNSLPADPPAVLTIEPLAGITGNGGVTISWQTGAADTAVSLYYTRQTAGLFSLHGVQNNSAPDRTALTLITANVTGNSFFWRTDLPSGNYYIYVEASNDYYASGDFAAGYISIAGHTSGSGGTGEKIWSFPNPFSPDRGQEARIAYNVEESGWTKVYVYDIRGRRVWQAENYARAGQDNIVAWDGRDGRGRLAANGLYVLILTNDKNKIIARGRLALHD
ncbi:MAG: hypothetical protein LBQ83_06430 [Candidatus Margulisbacteria bacterium]|nr:hypothetical protein [Candidatus Margulisiibacteriota bacterium]